MLNPIHCLLHAKHAKHVSKGDGSTFCIQGELVQHAIWLSSLFCKSSRPTKHGFQYKSNHASSDLSKEGMLTCSKCMLPVHPLDVATKLGREGRLHMHQMGHDVPDYERHMQAKGDQAGHALPGASRGAPNVTNKKEKKFDMHKVKNAVGAYKNAQQVSDDYSDSSSDEEEYKKPRTRKKAQKAHERRHNVDNGEFLSIPSMNRW